MRVKMTALVKVPFGCDSWALGLNVDFQPFKGRPLKIKLTGLKEIVQDVKDYAQGAFTKVKSLVCALPSGNGGPYEFLEVEVALQKVTPMNS